MIKYFLIILIIIILYYYLVIYKNNIIKENFQINEINKLENKLSKALKKNKDKIKKKNENNKQYIPKSKKFLKNNRIVITGATGGIGYHVAKMLNMYKPKLIICGKTKEKVDSVLEEFKKTNNNVYGISLDLSKEDSAEKLVKRIYEIFNNVDILINNAMTKDGARFLLYKKYNNWLNEINVNVNSSILLSQEVGYKMKIRKIQGKIINISSSAVKEASTDVKSGTENLMENMIEKYSKLLADELYQSKIAVTTIRIDEDINYGKKNIMNVEFNTKKYSKIFGSLFGKNPKDIMPIFIYAIKAPFYELSGKILSTKAFFNNKKLSKIIPPYQLKINEEIYNNIEYTKNNDKDENNIYLVKQNPYNMSPKVNKLLKNNKLFNNVNSGAKYKPILDNVIAKNLNITKGNIVFFKNEYDCIKKLVDIFVPKYQEIIVQNPTWDYLKLVSVENKVTLKYTVFKKNDNILELKYNNIMNNINSKTKMIYLSSPNIITGQHINKEDFNNFIKKVPDNILIVLDQRFIEFSNIDKYDLNALDYINNENIIIIRTFNNFYSIDALELTYIIGDLDLTKIIRDSQVLNPIDKFSETLALNVYKDNYYENTKKKINKEKKRMMKILSNNNIPYYPSDTNFFLVKTKKSKEEITNDLEERNIILYNSLDSYHNYWTLPVHTKEINDKIIDTILYSDL